MIIRGFGSDGRELENLFAPLLPAQQTAPLEQGVGLLETQFVEAQQEIAKLKRELDDAVAIKFEPEIKLEDVRALIAELQAPRG
jgi:hypothetical protein